MTQPQDITEKEIFLWQDYLEKICGIYVTPQKAYLLKGKLVPLIKENSCNNFTEFLTKVKNDFSKKLQKEVIESMTTNETLWFRDAKPFRILEELLLTKFHNKSRVKIWCAAASYGQEPYSIAMTILELKRLGKIPASMTIEINASDIDEMVLKHAQDGVYDSLAISRGLSLEFKNRYFTSSDKFFSINNKVKNMVKFKKLNLKDSYLSLGAQDIIFIRNVCIYFTPEFKKDICARLYALLKSSKGYLFLGSAESLSTYSTDYSLVSSLGGIYYQAK